MSVCAQHLDRDTGHLMRQRTIQTSIFRFRAAASVMALCVLWSVIACTGMDSAGLFPFEGERPTAYQDEQILSADASLRAHELASAQRTYDALVRADDVTTRGTARAGRALTTLFRLPGSPAALSLYKTLGADNTGYDPERLLWGDDGLLYWSARGASWQDSGQLKGIQSLVSRDLPWRVERLQSPEAFSAPLTGATHEIFDAAVALSAELAPIERDLEAAIADEGYQVFYLPPQLFHDDDMGLVLGRAELSLIRGVLAATRGAVHLMGAYAFTPSLADVLADDWQAVIDDPAHPEHVTGWSAADYRLRTLDTHLLRAVRDPARLTTARDAFDTSLGALATALRLGNKDDRATTTLSWERVRTTTAEQLAQLLDDARAALNASTTIRHTSPALTADLSSAFDPGLTLPAETPWLTRQDAEPDTTAWALNEEAIWSLTDPLASPAPRAWQDDDLKLATDEDAEGAVNTVLDPFTSRVQDAYLSSQ